MLIGEAAPAAAPLLPTLQELVRRRLWHELLLKFEAAALDAEDSAMGALVAVYAHTIAPNEAKFAPLRLAKVAALLCRRAPSLAASPSDALDRLKRLADVVRKASPEAAALLECTAAECLVALGRVADADALLASSHAVLAAATARATPPNAATWAAYYRGRCASLRATVAQSGCDDGDALHSALVRYAAYADPATTPVAEQEAIGAEIVETAVTSSKLTSFGTVLSLPIVASLAGSESASWLLDFAAAMHAGDTLATAALLPRALAHPPIAPHAAAVVAKARTMAVVALVFRAPAAAVGDGLALRVEALAAALGCDVDSAEDAVLAAIAAGALLGKLDLVDHKVVLEACEPRTLTPAESGVLRDRCAAWAERVRAVQRDHHLAAKAA